MNELFIPFGNIFSLLKSKAKGLYNFGYELVSASTHFNTYANEQEKLAMVLSNPAVLKVFSLQCDMFSMGRVCVKDEKGEEIPNDPFLNIIKDPNPFTNTESQFLWDFMFWNMMGTSYVYIDSALVDRPKNKMYILDPAHIEWPQELEKKKDKLIFSDSEINSIKKTIITYRYQDGTAFTFPFDRLVLGFDLTNSIGNFFKGPSRLDALYKIISNSEHVLDSENVNIRYTSKFMVGSDHQTGATTKLGLSEDEKNDIINKIDSRDKNVYPVKAKVNIQRFVEDLASLQLPQEYLHQYFLIGNMFNIPRDVLEAYNSATYENQQKARAAHVNYTLEPKGNQFMDSFEVHFGYKKQKKNIVITWDHLPFVQVFAKERVDVQKATVEVLNSLLQLGVPLDQVNKYLGTEFEIEKPEPAQTDGAIGQQSAADSEGGIGGDEEEGTSEEESRQGGESDQ
jgi:hypothetical protein